MTFQVNPLQTLGNMSREQKFANIYKEMYASGEGERGGQPAIVQIITNYYENQSNKLITILNQSTYSCTVIHLLQFQTKQK